MSTVEIRRAINAADVAAQASQYLAVELKKLLQTKSAVHFCLTGGTVGILTLQSLAENEVFLGLDLGRIHFWFGDERYVPKDSPDRNAEQAGTALLNKLNLPEANIHEFLSSETGLSVFEAAKKFESELFASFGNNPPAMDLMILGMGPDGHVASIFPGHSHTDGLIVAEPNSPKPPPLRLSMSLEMLNRSSQIVFVVSGIDKAEAIEKIHSGAVCDLPAAKVQAREETIWFIDEAAGAAFWSC